MAATAILCGDTARPQAARSEADARVAAARELAAAELTGLAIDPERAALLALQAADTTQAVDGLWTAEAEDALYRVVPHLRTELTLVGHGGRSWRSPSV
jgi:hypothetical protein